MSYKHPFFSHWSEADRIQRHDYTCNLYICGVWGSCFVFDWWSLGLVRCVLCDGWKTSCSCSLTVDRHSLILFIAGGSSNRIANTERVMACWLMISGAIHMIIEGAFSFALG